MGLEKFGEGMRKAKMIGDEVLDAITDRHRAPGTEVEYQTKVGELATLMKRLDANIQLPEIPEEYDFAVGQSIAKRAEELIIAGKDENGQVENVLRRINDMVHAGITKE